LTRTLNGKCLELCFLPDEQALSYVVRMQSEGLADTPKGQKRIAVVV
jgi:hypothetical protein